MTVVCVAGQVPVGRRDVRTVFGELPVSLRVDVVNLRPPFAYSYSSYSARARETLDGASAYFFCLLLGFLVHDVRTT